MTTIATDGRTMSGDGFTTTQGGTITDFHTVKVKKLKDGRIVGIAGDAYAWNRFLDWLENGGDPPELGDRFEALVLSRGGKVVSYNGECAVLEEPKRAAIGSGKDCAFAILDLGMTSREAVQAAAKRDVYTGGKITTLSLN